MVLQCNKFLRLMLKFRVTADMVAYELGITPRELIDLIQNNGYWDYDKSKVLLAMFGADEMLSVIDWSAVYATSFS